MKTKSSIYVLLSNLVYVLLQYLLVRYPLYFVFQNKDWVLLMGIVTLVLVVIGYRSLTWLSLWLTSSLYLIGFCCSVLFQSISVDPSGGTVSNWWLIWLLSVVIGFILIALLDRLIVKKSHRK